MESVYVVNLGNCPGGPRKESHTVKSIPLEKRFCSLFHHEFNNVGGEQKFTRTVGSFPHSYTVSLDLLLHLKFVLIWAWHGLDFWPFIARQIHGVYGRRRALTKDTSFETIDFKCRSERIKKHKRT